MEISRICHFRSSRIPLPKWNCFPKKISTALSNSSLSKSHGISHYSKKPHSERLFKYLCLLFWVFLSPSLPLGCQATVSQTVSAPAQSNPAPPWCSNWKLLVLPGPVLSKVELESFKGTCLKNTWITDRISHISVDHAEALVTACFFSQLCWIIKLFIQQLLLYTH